MFSGYYTRDIIGECVICKNKNLRGAREAIREESTEQEIEICRECLRRCTYTNSHGYMFLKLPNGLYMREPLMTLDLTFNKVKDEEQIKQAFNPDWYKFEKWLTEPITPNASEAE